MGQDSESLGRVNVLSDDPNSLPNKHKKELILIDRTLKMPGNWNLVGLDIKVIKIPKTRLKALTTSSASSLGVMPKFQIEDYLPKLLSDGISEKLFVKAGRPINNFYGHLEPITEYICYKIGILLGFDCVHTRLWAIDSELFGIEKLDSTLKSKFSTLCGKSISRDFCLNDRTLCSVSKNFLSENQSFIKAGKMLMALGIDDPKQLTKQELYNALIKITGRVNIDRMIIFDYLINNTDRHLGNFGWCLVDHDFEPAPLFDHGFSLCNTISLEDIQEHDQDVLSFESGKPFGSLSGALSLIDQNSLKGLRFDKNTLNSILKLLRPYRGVFGRDRYSLIESFLKRRFENVRKMVPKV